MAYLKQVAYPSFELEKRVTVAVSHPWIVLVRAMAPKWPADDALLGKVLRARFSRRPIGDAGQEIVKKIDCNESHGT